MSMAVQHGLTTAAPGELPQLPVSKTSAELLNGLRQGATHLKPVQAAVCLKGEVLWLLKRVDVSIFDKQVPQVECLWKQRRQTFGLHRNTALEFKSELLLRREEFT